MGISFKQIETKDYEVSKVQQNIAKTLAPLIDNPFINGTIINNVVIQTSETKVQHRLNKPYSGYMIIGKNANAIIYDNPDQNEKSSYLVLRASALVTISVFVF